MLYCACTSLAAPPDAFYEAGVWQAVVHGGHGTAARAVHGASACASYATAVEAATAHRVQGSRGAAVYIRRAVDVCTPDGPVSLWVPHAVLTGFAQGSVLKVQSAERVELCADDGALEGAADSAPAPCFTAFDVLGEASPAVHAFTPRHTDPRAWGAGVWWVNWAPGVATALIDTRASASPTHAPRAVPCAAPPCLTLDGAAACASSPAVATAHARHVRNALRAAGYDSDDAAVRIPAPRGVPPAVWDGITARLSERTPCAHEARALACIVADAAAYVDAPEYLEYYAAHVVVTRAERDAIAGAAQRGTDWFAHRACRWTGSRMAKAANMSDYNMSLHRLVREMLFPPTFSNAAMQHGVDNEPRAFRAALHSQRAASVADGAPWYDECGMVVHWTQPWIGGSPDMIVLARTRAGVLAGAAARTPHDEELACPTPLGEADLPECVLRPATRHGATHAAIGELKCPTRGRFYAGDVWGKADYAAQLHCNMACAGLRASVFAQFLTGGAQRAQRVAWDAAYWDALMHTARLAYFGQLLPRLVWKQQGVLDPMTLLPVAPEPGVVTLDAGCSVLHALDDDDDVALGDAPPHHATAPAKSGVSSFAHMMRRKA